MPELPEVETVVRMIRPKVVGRTFTAARVAWKRTTGASERAFASSVVGARVVAVRRRAKYFVLDLARGETPAGALLGHLRMTGRVHVEHAGYDPGPYWKVALDLDDGATFHFVDVRKFGRLEWKRDVERELADLGPEPLGDGFTSAWLVRALASRRGALKPLLLDQTFVAGLGNIYVDESLHRAGLHPLAPADRVPRERAERLHSAIREVLLAAIEREGSSFDVFYRTPEGQPGGFQDEFRVYDRAGEPCTTCGTPITRIVVGQRGTHFCTSCQPRPRRRSSGTGKRATG